MIKQRSLIFIMIGLTIISAFLICYVLYSKATHEGFYPVSDDRIALGNDAVRMYNDFAATQRPDHLGVIAGGIKGDGQLHKALETGAYENNSNNRQSLASPNYDDEFKYKAPPEMKEIMARIAKCESVKSWDCNAFEDPEFMRYCGICTKDRTTYDNKDHIGGLYIDPQSATEGAKAAAKTGKPYTYTPSAGTCGGEFILGRPYCDIQQDRDDCRKAQSFDSAGDKCALCMNAVEPNRFVYINDRKDKSGGYGLKYKKQIHFPVNLRICLAQTAGIQITVEDDKGKVVGSIDRTKGFIGNSDTALLTLRDCYEGKRFKVKIRLPRFKNYEWTSDDKTQIAELSGPKHAKLVRAMYGPNINDYKKDDDRAVDVSAYVKSHFGITDCSKFSVSATNDGLGGDPTYGIYKQLRLVYSDNGTDFAYAYTGEGGVSKPVADDNFKRLCPVGASVKDAERAVCETNEGRAYVEGNITNYYGATAATGGGRCVEQLPKTVQGIAGMWESFGGAVKRYLPINHSVVMINGLNVDAIGPPILGTIKNSKYHKDKPRSQIVDLPDYLFWFWAKDHTSAECEFLLEVPATLRDPTHIDDMKLCPSGPLIQTKEASAKLQASVCEKAVDGKPQGPGSYTLDCIKSLYLASGCTPAGSGIPTTVAKAKTLMKDSMTGADLELSDIVDMFDNMYAIATTGSDTGGARATSEEYSRMAEECLGKIILDPCDTPQKLTGPHTMECLDFLFRNAGKNNANVGSTYNGLTNRSSGTDRTKSTPVMYCQRNGTLSPIASNGKPNFDAIQQANSHGGVGGVKEFYRQIHYDANFNTNPSSQKLALNQCYGVRVNIKPPTSKGIKARYLMIRPTQLRTDGYLQIAYLQVFNVQDVDVAANKPATAASVFDNSVASIAVTGQAGTRNYPNIYHSATPNPNTEWWMIDFGGVEEIAYAVYYNRSDCCDQRSRGMRVQLLSTDMSVVKEQQLVGGMVETVMFANAKPASLIRMGIAFTFIPAKDPGSVLSGLPTGEVMINKNVRTKVFADTTDFVVYAANNNLGGCFSFKHKTSDRWIRQQGFRLRLTNDDRSTAFKTESSFKVVDSVAGNPGEISFESAANPGMYLLTAENGGVYIGSAVDRDQQTRASWLLPVTRNN
jgi:Alpha-L-arabinofuranosidase B (ABFB) domain